MEKCDKGFEGMCCCNCKHFIQANKHPANKIAKGSIMDKFSNICLNVGEDGSGEAVIAEWEHWMCEMYYPKEK